MLSYAKRLTQRLSDLAGHKIGRSAFMYSVYSSYFLFIVSFLGLSLVDPSYLFTLESVMKTYVALFLVLRFNPLTDTRPSEMDKGISFSAGLFLLFTTSVGVIARTFFSSAVSSSEHHVLHASSSFS